MHSVNGFERKKGLPGEKGSAKKAFLKYIFSLLLFGSNGVVAHSVALNSYEIVLLRSVIGSAVLLALFFITGQKITAFSKKKDLLFIALSGVAMAADWLFLFESYSEIGVSLGVLINYCGPAVVVALSPLVFKERLTALKTASLLAALAGVFLISGQAITNGVSVYGLLCAGLSALSYAAMIISNKLSKQIVGMENATLQLLFATITIILFFIFKQGFTLQIKADDWLPILWLGVMNTGIGCYFYFSSIGALPVQTVAVCSYLEPLSAVLFSVIILKERMMPLQCAGALLIIAGAVLNSRKQKE